MKKQQNTGLGWLAPTPRLIVFILISTLITFSSSWLTVIISFVAALVLLVLGRKYPRAAIFAAVSAFVLTFLGHALSAQGPDTFRFLVFQVSQASMLKGLRLGLRLVAMILPAIAFIAVTPVYELLEAFVGLHIPASAVMYLTIVLRYVDILWYDIQISMKAMAVRGVNWEGSIVDRIAAFRRLMLPLIFRILDHVDGQSLAIDNRGGVRVSRETPHTTEGVPALSYQHAYVRYDEKSDPNDPHALSDLTFDIEQGGATILLGRIGAGKSSTLLLATGLIPKSAGRMRGDVEIYGHNTKDASLSLLGRLARIVFPSAVQGLVGLTVEGELEFSLRSTELEADQKTAAMVDALEIVGLNESFLPRLTLGLSGGEMQRVALASAIVSQPQLLALDDVTVQLDPVGKREVVAALQTLLGGRVTTIMTDPYVDLLTEVGDRFISLEDGRVVRDRSTLDAVAIRRASLPVPQMMQLSEALGVDLPSRVEDAAEYLRSLDVSGAALAAKSAVEDRPIIVRGEGLVYTYPNGPTAVKGIDVSFRQGEFVAILGSNGSGKTTLALTLAGAFSPTEGRITIDDEVFDWDRHRGSIGYVFQEPVNQIVSMTVTDELEFAPRMLGWDEDAIREVVAQETARFDLNPTDVPLHLTPAEARKLAIAATLTMKPRLVILDEPTNNLDDDEVQHLMLHLKALQESGTTVILITHDIAVACDYADRVIVMSDGQIKIDGNIREAMKQTDILDQCDVIVPPVVALSLALWPDEDPVLSVNEMLNSHLKPITV